MRPAILLVVVFCMHTVQAAKPVVEKIDWPSFMAQQDMLWNRLPDNWFNAPFLGNGEQGTLMYKLNDRTLRWDVGCSAAHEHRPVEKQDYSDKNPTVLNRGRHLIGHLQLKLPEGVTGAKSRLSLWNAEATGSLTTAKGTLDWATLVHATKPVMRFEIEGKGSLKDAALVYVAEEARNPRAVRALTLKKPVDERRIPVNPSPELATLSDGVQTAVHNLYAGGQTAVAWVVKTTGSKKTLWLSVKHSYPDKNALNEAVAAVRAAVRADQDAWVEAHRSWWHNYYPQSFVSTGDSYWDSFYWIQQYKLACATRDKGWIIDNQGPWLQPTAWPSLWWNLNVELSHSGGFTANRRGMVSAMSYRLGVNRDNLAKNVAEPYRADSYALGRSTSGWDLLGDAGQPGGREPLDPKIGRETGNLLWGIHNIDQEYRYWMDTTLRDSVLYPLLTRAVNYYRHFLVENTDGQLSLPETFSPEYRIAADCTYDLDLLGWGVERLLELANEKELSEKNEPLLPVWKDIQSRLVPVHVNQESGRMIGRNVELTGRHRHWSHLMAIYPLRTLTPSTPENRELIDRSLTHWHSFGRAMGYSFTGGACMAAMLGDGERALNFLNGLKSFLQPNTFYYEIDHLPVMETPLHGATAMQEMLLQSWNGKLRIFPAVPAEWPDIQFHQLRGEGSFLVSARQEQNKTQWVLVKAEAGGTVKVDPHLEKAQWLSAKNVTVKNNQGVYTIETAPGDWVLFWPENQAQPETNVTPIASRNGKYRFGIPQ